MNAHEALQQTLNAYNDVYEHIKEASKEGKFKVTIPVNYNKRNDIIRALKTKGYDVKYDMKAFEDFKETGEFNLLVRWEYPK